MEERIEHSRNRGIILIVVLFLVVILSVIVFQFEFSVGVEKRISEYRIESLKASYNIRSKIELAKLSILRDAPLLAKSPDEADIEETDITAPEPTPGEMFGITITDASSRININNIVDRRGKPDKNIMNAVEKILLGLDLDPGIAEILVDFIDADTNASVGEQEKDYYLNRPLHNLTELALIPDFPASFFKRPDPENTSAEVKPDPSVYDYFTVYSYGKININTATPEVLTSLLANPSDEEAVLSIIEERKTAPFKSLTEVFQVKGASRGMFGSFERLMTVKPSVFIVEAKDTQGSVTRRGYAVFRRERDKVSMMYYHEE